MLILAANEKQASEKKQNSKNTETSKKPVIPQSLYRITNVRELMAMVDKNKFILMDPQFWPDEVDARMMELYDKKVNNNQKTYSLCFSGRKPESLMWQVYGRNAYSVCLVFDGIKLKNLVDEIPGACLRKVQYLGKRDKRYEKKYEEYPFIKRNVFTQEAEYRLIYNMEKMSLNGGISWRDLISEIVISPFAQTDKVSAILNSRKMNFGNKIQPSKIFKDQDFIRVYCPEDNELNQPKKEK